jgi:hypothetical protein
METIPSKMYMDTFGRKIPLDLMEYIGDSISIAQLFKVYTTPKEVD